MKKLPDEVLKEIIDYLAKKPYAEVAILISKLAKLENIEDIETSKKVLNNK